MKVNLVTNTRWLVFFTLMLAHFSYGQFFNNGSNITVTNDAVVFLKGMDLINADSTIHNFGTIIVEGNCIISKKSNSRIVTSNSDSLIVFKNFYDSSTVGQGSGVLVLKGLAQSLYSSSSKFSSLSLEGAGLKTLQSNISVNSNLHLLKGHIVPNSYVFGLDSTSTISPASPGLNSFVVGALYRKRKLGAEDSLLFPIGSSVTEYRPATLSGIALSSAKFPVFGVSTKNASPSAGNEVTTTYSRIWNVSNPANATVQHIKLYYVSSEVGSSSPSSLVVAQSSTEASPYNSIGALEATVSYVKSEFKPTEAYYTIGSSNSLYGNFKVFLEGATDDGSTVMNTGLRSSNVLTDSLLKIYPMLAGYSVASSAVDRITFSLVDSITGLAVDTAYAWLMNDGSIRDYATCTKNNVSFTKAVPITKYFVYASHRNHLPASSKSLALNSIKPSPTTFNHDYSKGVYGGGAKYDAGSGLWLLYASDPYKSWKNQTDVLDLLRTWADEDAGTYRLPGKYYYRNTDLDLDGVVNAKDQIIANDHNNKLFYSTLPK